MRIPFKFMPASWGLHGESYERAKIEYEERDPYFREIKLFELDHKYDIDSKECKLIRLEIDLKHGKINKRTYEYAKNDIVNDDIVAHQLGRLELDHKYGAIKDYVYEMEKAELTLDGDELLIKQAEINYNHRIITYHQYNKTCHDIQKLPYFEYIEITPDEENPTVVEFKLDWNDIFIELCHSHGIIGRTEEETVEEWLAIISRNQALDYFREMVDDEKDELSQLTRSERP